MAFFAFHVQNRDYKPGEVLVILNDAPYKHHALASGQHLYSIGTVMETIGMPFSVVGNVLGGMAHGLHVYDESQALDRGDYAKAGYHRAVRQDMARHAERSKKAADLNGNKEYGVLDMPRGETYSGREVAKLIDMLANDQKKWFVSNKQDIVLDFIEHKYVNADIPTTDHHSFWGNVILDAYSHELVNHMAEPVDVLYA